MINESDDLNTETQPFSSELLDGEGSPVSNFVGGLTQLEMLKGKVVRRTSQDANVSKAVIRTERVQPKNKASNHSAALRMIPNFGTLQIAEEDDTTALNYQVSPRLGKVTPFSKQGY